MSAELLREAAAKMRERAEAATPGPWTAEPQARPLLAVPDWLVRPDVTADVTRGDAAHIASWHPAVAIAVAKLLEEMADALAAYPDLGTEADEAAETFARAYLGRPDDEQERVRKELTEMFMDDLDAIGRGQT